MPAFKKVRKESETRLLTDETIDKICNNLRLGHYIETACVMAGVRKRTFYDWIEKANRNPQANNKFTKLLHAVEKAQGEAETRDLFVIDKCANGRKPEFLRDDNGNLVLNDNGNPIFVERGMDPDWSAAAWRLERRFPSKWGKTDKLELTGKDGEPINSTETPEERRARIAEKIKKLKLLDE